MTALPDNDIGRAACRELMRYGVKTDNIVYTGDRLGIFFAEKGASQRPSKVIYDRKNSAIASADPSSFDWEKIFDGADWFHITGITPALSDSLARISVDAVKAAKKAGLTVSCDINYRSKLWSAEKARPVMTEIMQYVDVCIGNEEDAEIVFGIKAGATDVTKGQLDTDGYKKSLQTVAETFGCKIVAYSQRKSYSASDNGWSGIIYDDEKKQVYTSAQYDIRIKKYPVIRMAVINKGSIIKNAFRFELNNEEKMRKEITSYDAIIPESINIDTAPIKNPGESVLRYKRIRLVDQ